MNLDARKNLEGLSFRWSQDHPRPDRWDDLHGSSIQLLTLTLENVANFGDDETKNDLAFQDRKNNEKQLLKNEEQLSGSKKINWRSRLPIEKNDESKTEKRI